MSTEAVPEPLISVASRARRQFLQDIRAGVFPKGTVLPPQRALARRYDVSTATIHRILREMNEKGLVKTIQSKGSYVLGDSDDADGGARRDLVKATLTLMTEMHMGMEQITEREKIERKAHEDFLFERPEYRIRYRPRRSPLKVLMVGFREKLFEERGCSVIQFHRRFIPLHVREDTMVQLQEEAGRVGLADIYRPEVWEACWCGGRLLGLPVRLINPLALFYNRATLERHAPGVDPARMSWDEFVEVAKQVGQRAGLLSPVTIASEEVLARLVLTLIMQRDGCEQSRDSRTWWIAFDTDLFVKSFGQVREAFLQLGMNMAPDLWSNAPQTRGLREGKHCFVIGDTLYDPVDPDEIGVVPIPVVDGGHKVLLTSLVMEGIRFRNSYPVRTAAWEYLLFRARPEYAAEACRAGVEHPKRLVYRPEYLDHEKLADFATDEKGLVKFHHLDADLADCSLEPISAYFSLGVLLRLLLLETLFPTTTDWKKRVADMAESVSIKPSNARKPVNCLLGDMAQ